jgi:undecaprenyl diphosphate synthase
MARVAEDAVAGRLSPDKIDEAAVTARLDTHMLPDPDLIVRTSGETRVSNFLLWQAAYAEYVFTPILWPDFTPQRMVEILNDFAARDRRFGGVKV